MPTLAPSVTPTLSPTLSPTGASAYNSLQPSLMPSLTPSVMPTLLPSAPPSAEPSSSPSSAATEAAVPGFWVTRNSLPIASTDGAQSCAAVGSLVYMYTYTPPYDPVSSEGFYKYETMTDTWAAGMALVHASVLHLIRAACLLFTIDSFAQTLLAITSAAHTTVVRYWSVPSRRHGCAPNEHAVCAANRSPMSATSYLATASYGTYVYQLDGTTPKSLKYSTTTDAWTVIKSIPTGRMGDSAGAVTVGTRIYVFGGANNPLSASNTNLRNEAYDTQTDTWATKAALPSRQTNGAVGVKGNTAFVAGGSPAVNTLQIYDAAADSWTSGIAALPTHARAQRT